MGEPQLEHWADDIACLRLPMPAFGGVNAFILGPSDDRVIVDTGMPGGETARVWEAVRQDGTLGRVAGIVCTHAHIDHIGQTGPLVRETGAPLFMSASEFEDAAHLVALTAEERWRLAEAFQDDGGFPQAGRGVPSDYSALAPFPRPSHIVQDGDRLTLGGEEWAVLIGGGHSRAPISLISSDRKLLLAGDQLLHGLGPQIPVQAERPDEDALGAYFCFLDRLDTLPDDLVVFPGHGEPIRDFKAQASAIRKGHLRRIDKLLGSIAGVKTAAELAELVFPRASSRLRARMPYLIAAMTNYLVSEGRLEVCEPPGRAGGAHLYRRT